MRAGGAARLRFTLKAEHLAIADASGDQIVRAGDYEVFFKASTDAELLRAPITLGGEDRVVASFAL